MQRNGHLSCLTREAALLGWARGWIEPLITRHVTPRIDVETVSPEEFQVRVADAKSERSYRVTLKKPDYHRIAAGTVEPAELVRRSFEFLLENEPKESILARFDLPIIGRYFPQYEREMKRRLTEKS